MSPFPFEQPEKEEAAIIMSRTALNQRELFFITSGLLSGFLYYSLIVRIR